MAGERETQRKNHVKFYAISGLNLSRRNPGGEVGKDEAWLEVRGIDPWDGFPVSGLKAGEAMP